MRDSNRVRDLYVAGLRNQHAVETQAIGTLQNQIPCMDAYPELQARMRADKDRSEQQAARLDQLLGQQSTARSVFKEAVAGTVATVAGFVHATASDEVLKNVLSAIGFKAYEIASYKALIALANASGAAGDVPVLEGSMREEQEMGDWLGSHLPDFVARFIAQGGLTDPEYVIRTGCWFVGQDEGLRPSNLPEAEPLDSVPGTVLVGQVGAGDRR